MDSKTELVLEILRRSSNPKSDNWPDDEKALYEEYSTVGSLTEAVEAVRRLRAKKIIEALTLEGPITPEEQLELRTRDITQQICEALKIPYESPDGHGVRYCTLGEALERVESRSDMWRAFLTMFEEVDPERINDMRQRGGVFKDLPDHKSAAKMAAEQDPDVIFTVTLRNNNILDMWHRESLSMPDFVQKLLTIATKLASGEANRIG